MSKTGSPDPTDLVFQLYAVDVHALHGILLVGSGCSPLT